MDVCSVELFSKHACMGKGETSWPLLCVRVVTQAGHVCSATSMHVCIPTFSSGKQSMLRLELMQLTVCNPLSLYCYLIWQDPVFF